MPKLSWIDDAELSVAARFLLDKAKLAKEQSKADFGRNVIDPFSAIFEISGFGIGGYDAWVLTEEARQAQKTLQNFVGEFHQTILGSCEGWTNLKTGNIVDLENREDKIIAEIKNKYNTISGGQLAGLYKSLSSAVMSKTSKYKKYTAFYVTIIPKKPKRFNVEFTPSDKETGNKCASNKLIRHIDGASFYELVTGDKNALRDLFTVLPDVIQEISGINTLDKGKLIKLFSLAYGDL